MVFSVFLPFAKLTLGRFFSPFGPRPTLWRSCCIMAVPRKSSSNCMAEPCQQIQQMQQIQRVRCFGHLSAMPSYQSWVFSVSVCLILFRLPPQGSKTLHFLVDTFTDPTLPGPIFSAPVGCSLRSWMYECTWRIELIHDDKSWTYNERVGLENSRWKCGCK